MPVKLQILRAERAKLPGGASNPFVLQTTFEGAEFDDVSLEDAKTYIKTLDMRFPIPASWTVFMYTGDDWGTPQITTEEEWQKWKALEKDHLLIRGEYMFTCCRIA